MTKGDGKKARKADRKGKGRSLASPPSRVLDKDKKKDNDITGNILSRKKRDKLLSEIDGEIDLNRPIHYRVLEGMASRSGLDPESGKHGYVWSANPLTVPPFNIPRHGGGQVPNGTKQSILGDIRQHIIMCGLAPEEEEN